MSEFRKLPKLPDWLTDYDVEAGHGIPRLDDYHAAGAVLPNHNYEAQLIAIDHMLEVHRDRKDALRRDLENLDAMARKASGARNDRLVEEFGDRFHQGVYEDAARSMSAVGMLAPMLESVFYQSFQKMRGLALEDLGLEPESHTRWIRPAEDQWDCRFVWNNGRRQKDIVRGIMQLSDATGLKVHLPDDLEHVLQALFEYRNKMFHNGFEWPLDERRRFARRIEDAGWPHTWFERATTGDEPWMFYMSAEFIEHTVETIHSVILGLGAYCNDRFLGDSSRSAD